MIMRHCFARHPCSAPLFSASGILSFHWGYFCSQRKCAFLPQWLSRFWLSDCHTKWLIQRSRICKETQYLAVVLTDKFVKCVCRNLRVTQGKQSFHLRQNCFSIFTEFIVAMATNAEQQKWRQIRISSVSSSYRSDTTEPLFLFRESRGVWLSQSSTRTPSTSGYGEFWTSWLVSFSLPVLIPLNHSCAPLLGQFVRPLLRFVFQVYQEYPRVIWSVNQLSQLVIQPVVQSFSKSVSRSFRLSICY